MAERSNQNFRRSYYQKLGSTAATEERNNFSKLLDNDVIDLKKLEQFSLHLNVPSDFRCDVWKILLKISPSYRRAGDYVKDQRQEHYDELKRIAGVIPIGDGVESEINRLTLMYLIESGTYMLQKDTIFTLEEALTFSRIFCAVERLQFNLSDSYWVARNFCNYVREKVHPVIPVMIEQVLQHLQREDGKLFSHLHRIGSLDCIPLAEWFSTCFATALPETTFERVWDKVMSGALLVLIYIAVAMVIVNKRPLMVIGIGSEINRVFFMMAVDTAEAIVGTGLALWQKHGSKLTCSARASPVSTHERPSSWTPHERPAS